MNKGGRPRKEIDIKQFEKLCAIQCTESEMAAWFEMTRDTLEARIMDHYGESFSTVFGQKRGKGKIALRRMQMQAAERGNSALLIFLGKQYLGQKDKHESEVHGSVNINYSDASEENEDD